MVKQRVQIFSEIVWLSRFFSRCVVLLFDTRLLYEPRRAGEDHEGARIDTKFSIYTSLRALRLCENYCQR